MKKVYIPSVGLVEASEENRKLFELFGRQNELENATDNQGTTEHVSNGSEPIEPERELPVRVHKRPRKKGTGNDTNESEQPHEQV